MTWMTKWQERLLKASGNEALEGASKHNRGTTKSPNWRARRKKRRKTTQASRRRNQ